MKDNLSVALEDMVFNQTETYDGKNLGYIRWGFVTGADGKQRALAFFASLPEAQAAHMAGKDLMIESNAAAKREDTLNGPERQAFEWLHTEFVPVDADKQTWFRFR